jgi:hypothetical protein
LFQLENSRTEQEIQDVLVHLIDWLKDPKQTSLRRAFTVWFNRVLLPIKAPNVQFTELNNLNEVHTMLAERVKQWTQDWLQEGRQEECISLVTRLLRRKFGIHPELEPALAQLQTLSIERLENLAEVIFDWTDISDLIGWLKH